MTTPATERRDETASRTISFPVTPTTQRAIHEALGHCYDELAIARQRGEEGAALPDEVFDAIEVLYVAAAEESIARLELSYELEQAEKT